MGTSYLVSTKNNYKRYRANLSQNQINSQNSGSLIIGERYVITNYNSSDDFTNVSGFVFSGTPNTTGFDFIANGEVPNIWENGTEVINYGYLLVDVLENTLGEDVTYEYVDAGLYNVHVGDTNSSSINNTRTYTTIGSNSSVVYSAPNTNVFVTATLFRSAYNAFIGISAKWYDGISYINDNGLLVNTPFEITVYDNEINPPKVLLDHCNVYAESIETFSVTFYSGSSEIIDMGIVYSDSNQYPTLYDTSINYGTPGLGAYQILIEGLNPTTTYYIRSYVTNQYGTNYSEPQEHTTTS